MLARSNLRRTPMKVTRRKPTTAVERRHLNRVAGMGCLVCGGAAEIHHVVSDGWQRLSRKHTRITPLCPVHHRTGADAVHVIGHRGFMAWHGIDPLAVAVRLWDETAALEWEKRA